MPFFQSQDATIHYQTFGDKTSPAVVFSNSLGTSYQMWQDQIDVLQQHFFVICYDTRGHGASSAPSGAYTLEQLGTDVIRLLDYLEIKQSAFCGISMGGLTGQWLAIHASERIQRMIVANTAARIGNEQAWLDRAQLARTQGLLPIAETAPSRWFTYPFIQSHHDKIQILINDLAAGNASGYASCCEALAKADMREQLQQIQIPMLIIAGKQDPITTVEDARFMQQRIPQAQFTEIAASHISNIEAPEQFNQIIQDFLLSS